LRGDRLSSIDGGLKDGKIGQCQCLRVSAGEEVFFGQIPLILPDIRIVFGSVACLYLDLLGLFPAGIDPVAFNHLPICMRIFQMHVERGRIGSADPFKSSLAAPEFNAALEVRVENPHAILSPKGPGWSLAFSRGYLIAGRRG